MEMDRNTLQHTDVGLPTGNMFEQVRSKIMTVRETVVILDADIADLYGVETKRVNEAVKNNPDKFPSTYMFRLTREEMIFLRSKNPTHAPVKVIVKDLPYSRREDCICWLLY